MTAFATADPVSTPMPADELKRIDVVCAAYESAWADGHQPDIAEFLGDTPEPARKTLFRELLLAEREFRSRAGETLTLNPYQERFPEYRGMIDRVVSADSTDGRSTIEYRGGSSPSQSLAKSERVVRPKAILAAPTVGGYQIVKELGRGGMGVVYLARHVKLNRLVALKMILTGDLATADQIARLHSESLAVARVKHPNLVQIYSGGRHNGKPFLALEFIEGGGLDARIGGTPQPPREAARFLEKVARGVHAVHAAGIVHRDLKPSNILIDEVDAAARPLGECTPKVTDFGLAKSLVDEAGAPRLSHTANIVGTPAYLSPEQARARPVSPLTDVYSLGVILYELLTGRVPFDGKTVIETLSQVTTQAPLPPRKLRPTCPRDLETICLKCLEKDPARRYASAKHLADDPCRVRGSSSDCRPPGGAVRTGSTLGRTESGRRGPPRRHRVAVDVGHDRVHHTRRPGESVGKYGRRPRGRRPPGTGPGHRPGDCRRRSTGAGQATWQPPKPKRGQRPSGWPTPTKCVWPNARPNGGWCRKPGCFSICAVRKSAVGNMLTSWRSPRRAACCSAG